MLCLLGLVLRNKFDAEIVVHTALALLFFFRFLICEEIVWIFGLILYVVVSHIHSKLSSEKQLNISGIGLTTS